MPKTARSGKGALGNKQKAKGNPNWRKGVSGNPNGRPKVAIHFRERCRAFMDESGWAALHQMANDPDCRDRFNALKLLAAYAVGSPIQATESAPQQTHVTVELVDATAQATDGD